MLSTWRAPHHTKSKKIQKLKKDRDFFWALFQTALFLLYLFFLSTMTPEDRKARALKAYKLLKIIEESDDDDLFFFLLVTGKQQILLLGC